MHGAIAMSGAANQHGTQSGPVIVGAGAGIVSGLPAKFVVTIDGQAATGKSSTGLRLAQRLGASFLDTGAMYRDATALALERRVPIDDAQAIIRLVQAERTEGMQWVRSPGNGYAGLLQSPEFVERLRSAAVDAAVSVVAKHKALRELLIDWQRRAAVDHGRLVTEGRDQGSVVFKTSALCKFFLVASPQVRAQRRAEQLTARGVLADVGAIEANLVSRDQIDASHAMRFDEDMIEVNTTKLTEDQVVDHLVTLVRQAAADRASE